MRITRDGGAVVQLRVAGEVDLSTCEQLAAAVNDAVASPGFEKVVVDLGEVGFLDSSGLRALVDGLKGAKARGGTLVTTNVPPLVRKAMDITGLTEVLGADTADRTTDETPG